MASCEEAPYNFHLVNIHERTGAAYFCRALPITIFVTWLGIIFYGMFHWTQLLIFCSAITNVLMWLWIVVNCLFSFVGVLRCNHACAAVAAASPSSTSQDTDVVHVCVIPNYSEDEEMMADTLQALAECHLADSLRVVLAMEAREGEAGSAKGDRLHRRFEGQFAAILVTQHPGDLQETHLDEAMDAEVPGKASNLKWAVRAACEDCEESGIKVANVLVTVLDADCLMHPGYFQYVDVQHRQLRAECKRTGGEDYLWTGYQAPQASFRNYYESPVCSRAWSYISCLFELGGVSSLDAGGNHMFFSSYTLPLQLAMNAGLWSGDVVAEDHHIYLKCFFYSIRSQLMRGVGAHPLLNLVSVPLPIKSTAVISPDGYWRTCVDRFHQAKRHAQGISELEYAFLALGTLLCRVPLCAYSLEAVWRLVKTVGRLLCLHVLPVLQSVTFAIVSLWWLFNNQTIPGCPDRIWLSNFDNPNHILCGLAGAWALSWPILIPLAMLMVANLMAIWSWFVAGRQAEEPNRPIWEREDGGVKPLCGSKFLTLLKLVLIDCGLLIMPVMAVYGMVPMCCAYVSTCVWGNRIEYVTASKASSTQESLEQAAGNVRSYGTLDPVKGQKAAGQPEPEPMC